MTIDQADVSVSSPRTARIWTGRVITGLFVLFMIATHLRVGNPLASHTLFPLYVAVLLWGGLYLRDGRLQKIVRIAFARA